MPIDLSFQDSLYWHCEHYPLMQIEDLVKLAFQAAWAGGHLIQDEQEVRQRLQLEIESQKELRPVDRFEPIGNGLCRLNLMAVSQSGLSLETVCRFFIATANGHEGSPSIFSRHLSVLDQMMKEGIPLASPIRYEDWSHWLQAYRKKGCPAVHHSDIYRKAYRPAYRVVRAAYALFQPLFASIDQKLEEKEYLFVAIDGNSGAGKSTLAKLVHEVYGGNLFHMDDFFLEPHQRTLERLQEPGGNVNYERFFDEVILGVTSRKPFFYRTYDCKNQTLSRPILVHPARFNLVEGVYCLHPSLIQSYDLKVMLQTDRDRQLQRILERSGSALYQRFVKEWIPLEDRYFSALQIAEQCDLILNG